MLSTREILLSVLLPGIVSLLVMLLAWRPWRRRAAVAKLPEPPNAPAERQLDYAVADRGGPYWAGVLAIAGAFLIAFPNILGRAPAFPPGDFTTTLFYIASGVALVALIEALVRLPFAARVALALLLATAAATAGFWRQIHGGWPGEKAALLVAAIAIAGLIWWLSLDRLARAGGFFPPLLMLLLGSGVAVLLALLNNFAFGRMAGALTAGVGGVLVLSIWRRDLAPLARGGVLVFATLMLMLVVGAHELSDLSTRDALLMAAAPLGVWTGLLVPARRHRWARALVQLLLVLTPLATVFVLTQTQKSPKSLQPDASSLYGY